MRHCAAVLILGALPCLLQSQMSQVTPAGTEAQVPVSATVPSHDGQNQAGSASKPVRNSDRRQAAKKFLEASKLFEKEQFAEALLGYEAASKLDPGNGDYSLAVGVARSHLVTALIQEAAKDRLRGDAAATRAALARAIELDPKNAQATQHMYELGDDALLGVFKPLRDEKISTMGGPIELAPTAGVHSFHMRTPKRLMIQQVFKMYGIDATVDDSVPPAQARLDVDNVDFETATRVLALLTRSFYVPLDAHRVLVARDTHDLRQQFERLEVETIYLSGLSSTELSDVANLAKNVFQAQQAVAEPSAGTITIRAPQKSLTAFNATMRDLLDGRDQALLEVRMIQLAHISGRQTGINLPQTITAFNVYAAEQAILNANQDLVNQIISSGLAAPGDTLAIIAILLASGQVSSSLLSNGLVLFGGGLTLSALVPGTLSANLNLNSSDSRELDLIQLRLGDGEDATLRSGTRYPIQTSSFSSLSGSLPSIPGLTGAGASPSLTALLASYGGSVPNIPQVEYQDLGLTLKATPKILRNNDIALKIDLKISALSGGSINGNPILNNRAFSGVLTVKEGEAVVMVSELDKQESRAVSGTPGLSEIPGLNNLTGKESQKNYATLLIIITPRMIRGTQAAGHSPMMRVEHEQGVH